jgi:hypothetical protein
MSSNFIHRKKINKFFREGTILRKLNFSSEQTELIKNLVNDRSIEKSKPLFKSIIVFDNTL